MQDVLLITIDSLRADHLGCYGYDRPTSPTIDSLAESSHVFENAFAHAGVTRNSFPAILTSSYPHMYGGYERISERRTLVSELLSNEGYSTAGYHSNLYLSSDFGYARGFDTFYDSKSEPTITARLRQAAKQRLDQDSRLFSVLKRAFERTEKHAGVEIGSAYVDAEEITDLAVESVRSMDGDAPSFLWIHYMDVHHPYLPDAEFQRHFRDDPVPERRAVQLRRKMLESPEDVSDRERQDIVDLYDAEIRYTDREIGRLISTVREHWGEDVLIALLSDHGEEFGEHGQFSHNTHHDEGIHVPLILQSDPGGGRYDDMVGLIDVAPTIADSVGIDAPASFYGHSLERLVDGDSWPRNSVIGEWGPSEPGERRFFYRSRDWKYMRWDDVREELYDLKEDPRELENVASDEPPALADIRDAVDEHVELVDSTQTDLGDVEMDDSVKERLELLGYRE